jgi:hypothetical protein
LFVTVRQELRMRFTARKENPELLNCPLRQAKRQGKFCLATDVAVSRSTSTNRASAEVGLDDRKEEITGSDTTLRLASMEQSPRPSALSRIGSFVTLSPTN